MDLKYLVICISIAAIGLSHGFKTYKRRCAGISCEAPREYCKIDIINSFDASVCSPCINHCNHVKSEIPQGCNEFCTFENNEGNIYC